MALKPGDIDHHFPYLFSPEEEQARRNLHASGINPDDEPDRFPDQTGRIRPGDVGIRIGTRQVGGRVPYNVMKADYASWSGYLAQWTVLKPVHIQLTAERNGPIVYLRMRCDQPDAAMDQRLAAKISLQIEVPVPTPKPDETSNRWVRALVRWFVLHELDEWIEFKGKRIFDPHRDGRTPSPENS